MTYLFAAFVLAYLFPLRLSASGRRGAVKARLLSWGDKPSHLLPINPNALELINALQADVPTNPEEN